jgi:NADH-quinone oxidoreductase subunit M
MASLGLPGLGNFVAEFLTLIGAWKANHIWTIMAAIGLILGTVYSLRILQRVFYGKEQTDLVLQDLSLREKFILVPLVLVIIWLGLFPQPVLDTVKASPDIMNISHSEMENSPITQFERKGGMHE